MATRFIGKNIKKKIVRPMKNSVKNRNFAVTMEKPSVVSKTNKTEEKKEEETVPQKENKKTKKGKEMIAENKLAQMEAIAGTSLPKMNVKVEKVDKGLYERTEESTILLTEDNKMLLND